MPTYKVISLDVWGHSYKDCAKYDCPGGDRCDGFTVNDAHHTNRTVEIVEDATDEAIVAALIDAGELNEIARPKGAIKIDGEPDHMLYVEDGEDGRPLIHLECVQ